MTAQPPPLDKVRREKPIKKDPRQALLVNRPFQLRVLGYSVGLALGVVGLFYLSDLYYFWSLKKKFVALGLPPGHPLYDFLMHEEFIRDLLFTAIGGTVIVVIALAGLMLSHRIAGPLYQLQRHLCQATSEDSAQDVKFRAKDYFPELAQAFNALAAKLRARGWK